jgi:hypothetical protein
MCEEVWLEISRFKGTGVMQLHNIAIAILENVKDGYHAF